MPGLLFCLGMLLKSETGFYHLYSTDPVYAYLFDGLNICNLSVPFLVYGPGTPISLLCAVVTETLHLFRHQESLITDVMKNPDVYLSAINATIIAIQSILLFFLGFTVYKASKSIFTGIFFQLTPFFSWILIDIMRIIMVESIVVIGILLLIILVYSYIKSNDNEAKLIDKKLILFSFVIGFITASKLVYLPIAVIPFLLLPGYKKKGLFVGFSIITFAILAFPIFHYWVDFRDYYIDNFMHSGQYGQGPANIFNTDTVRTNLKYIFTSDGVYFKAFIIIIAGTLLYHLPYLKVKERNDKTYKALLGIAINMIIITLLVAKQFKFYYLLSALLLCVPGLYFVFSIFTRNISKNARTIIAVPAFLIVSFFLYHEVKTRVDWYPVNMIKKEDHLQTMKFVEENYGYDQPTLVIPNYYGVPYTAYGCFYGMAWCRGEMREIYADELKKHYPDIYFFHTWNNLFNYWDNSYSYTDLLRRYKKILLFSGDSDLENSMYSKLHGINRQIDTKIDTIISFSKTRQIMYSVDYDSALSISPFKVCFDAEILDSTREYFLNNEGFRAGNGNTQTSEFARSGLSSGKLTKENPYGMTISLGEVDAGEHYMISIWRYDNGNQNAGLVIAANDMEKLYIFNNNASTIENTWHKIVIDLIIPEKAHREDIKIYCWNNDPELPAYFDDLLIERIAR